jgi:hypothetical protein
MNALGRKPTIIVWSIWMSWNGCLAQVSIPSRVSKLLPKGDFLRKESNNPDVQDPRSKILMSNNPDVHNPNLFQRNWEPKRLSPRSCRPRDLSGRPLEQGFFIEIMNLFNGSYSQLQPHRLGRWGGGFWAPLAALARIHIKIHIHIHIHIYNL